MSTEQIRPNFYLPEDAFQILIGEGNWKTNEIPLALASEIKDHFGINTSFCVLGSGLAPVPKTSADDSPVAGIDWVRQEDKLQPGEKPLNVYHYMIAQKTELGYPVFHLGKDGTIAPHWSELEDLKVYFKDWE
jgi:hypothetical protein